MNIESIQHDTPEHSLLKEQVKGFGGESDHSEGNVILSAQSEKKKFKDHKNKIDKLKFITAPQAK